MKSVLMYAFRKKKGSIFPMFYKNDVAEESIHPSIHEHPKPQQKATFTFPFGPFSILSF